MQEHNNPTIATPSEAFFAALVGKPIVVHTLIGGQEASTHYGVAQAATLYGRLEANYPDALILEIAEPGQQSGARILVYKRAVVAVEARGTTTP